MEEQKMTPMMWVQLIEVRLRFIGLLILTGIIVGYWDTLVNYWNRFTRMSHPPATIEQAHIEFYCPMHPNIVRADMGNCPICGMPLSKRAKGVAAALPPDITGRITLSPYRIALAGVKTDTIRYMPLIREIETVGELVFDERKLSRISARFPGRIDKLYINFAGLGVKAADPLAEIYSPSLITTFEELLANAKTGQGLEGMTNAIKKKLMFWGVDEDQVNQVIKNGSAPDHLTIRSPINGVVTKKLVVEGQYVEEGANLFEMANMNVVWVMSKVYEEDLAMVKIGQNVTFETVSHPGASFSGSIAYIDPVLERDTRTVNVRIDLENTAMKLRPGMYGTVKIQIPISSLPEFAGSVERIAETLAAKSQNGGEGSGTKTVYWCPMHPEVEQDHPGECPKCGGMKLVEKKVAIPAVEQVVYTCTMHPEVEQDHPGDCPKCGMKLVIKKMLIPEDEKLVYSCPMHPEVVSESPGKCPICKPYMDMDLEPHSTTSMAHGVLAVPESAIIDTGRKQVAYVEVSEGLFEGRLVTLGPRAGTFYPVKSGLKPEDKVVSHGSFLIDAETRLNPAAGAAFVGASGGPTKKDAAPEAKPAGHQGNGG